MPDYAACRAVSCDRAPRCARFCMVPSEFGQSFIQPEDTDNCDMFWDRSKGAPFRMRDYPELEGTHDDTK